MTIGLQAKAAGWFAKNGLRLIAYVLLGLCIAIGTLVFYGVQRRAALKNDIATLRSSVDTLLQANETNQRTIKQLQEDSTLDDAVIAGLQDRFKNIDLEDERVRARIRTLETNNAEVRAWLRTPTPAGVGCVLDDSCGGEDGNRTPDAKQKPAPTVR